MRRLPRVTSVLVLCLLCLTTAVLTTAVTASAASARPRGVKATKVVKVPKVKAGSTWTLEIGSTCESDSFAARHKFSDVAVKGDAGTYKAKKILTMTWTAGAATGAVFKGTFAKASDDYVGPYSDNGQTQSATLVPAATFGCDVITTAPETNSIALGNSDVDTATVGGQGSITPTGTVHFYVCPGDSDPCTVTSSGVVDLGAVTLAGSGSIANALSAPYTPAATGSYCFLGVYSGDTHYGPLSDGSTTDECFTVTPDVAGVTTSPSSTSVALGVSDTDTATVTGLGGVTPTGTVHFYECAGTTSACTTSKAANGGTDLGSSPLSGAAGTATATSAPFTAPSTGAYCFLGVYSGDGTYASASDGSTTDECFTVTSGDLQVTTQPSTSDISQGSDGTVTDKATVTGVGGVTPTGTVTFYVCGPDQQPVACSVASGTQLGSPVALSGSAGTATTTSATFAPSTVTVTNYCFIGVYSGDGNYPSASDSSGTEECFDIDTGHP